MIELMRCASCHDELNVARENIICTSCGVIGNIERGVYHFTNQSVTSDNIIATSSENNSAWENTVRSQYQETGDLNWLNETVFTGNAASSLLVDLNQESIVLNLGCKLGKINQFLSQNAKQLFALDYQSTVIANAQKNISSEVSQKIQFIVADKKGTLPFADSSVDIVYLHKPSELQQLKEVHRVLRPEGQLLLIGLNKYSFDNLIPQKQIRFKNRLVNLMPDFIRLRLTNNNNEYAKATYEKALTNAGFSQVQCDYIEEISSQMVEIQLNRSYIRPPKKNTKGIKSYIKNYRGFKPAFCFVAMKEKGEVKSLLNAIHRDVSNYLQSSDLKFSSVSITGKSKAIIIGSNAATKYIIKIPFDQNGVEGESHNHEILQRLKKENNLALTYPDSLVKRQISGCDYFIETMCPGESLHASIKQFGRDHYAQSIFNAWKKLVNYNDNSKKTIVDEHLFNSLIGNTAAKLKLITQYEDKLDNLVNVLHQKIVGTEVHLGLFHGDFSVSNTFTSQGVVTGLIDWEVCKFEGACIIDLINIYTSVERLTRPSSTVVDNIENLLSAQWSNKLEWQFLMEGKNILNLSSEQFSVMVIASWFWGMYQQLETDFIYDAKAIEGRIDKFLLMVENSFNYDGTVT